MLVLAQVSDIHVDGTQVRNERAGRVMRYLDSLSPPVDAILLTGDIADHGLPEEYDEARKLLAGTSPVLPCPGNHDDRAAYRSAFLGVDASAVPINEAHRVGGVLVAMCDSTIPGEDGGYLADESLDWLDHTLRDAGDDVPALVCFHHPPVTLTLPYVDGIRLAGEDRLAEVLAHHDNVVAVLCGHAHTAAASTFAGRPLLVAPGVVSTLTLPWEPRDTIDYTLPPAIAFHVLDDQRRLTTHYRVVP
jgi:3',5'-cyclic-AMP phosphodiesterase